MDSRAPLEVHDIFMPSMSTAEYSRFVNKVKTTLREHYRVVESPILGPYREEIESIDIFVTKPRQFSDSLEDRFESLSAALGGAATFILDDTATIAIPWEMEDPTQDTRPIGSHDFTEIDGRFTFYRVDITICISRKQLSWMVCRHCHGGLWSLIGSVIRPFGLYVNGKGLWITLRRVRIERDYYVDLDILLTSHPERAFEFLDLCPERFWGGQFSKLDEMFQYVAACRFFAAIQSQDNIQQDGRNLAVENCRRDLASDVMYQLWYRKFLPDCEAAGHFLHPQLQRGQIAQEAISFFQRQAVLDSKCQHLQQHRQRMRDAIARANQAVFGFPSPVSP